MMRFLRRHILFLVVFATGAAVLIVEVTATRILSPYFGNTIFTVSSVISVILGALSCGYYFGGRLADRYPHARHFYALITASGLSVLLLRLLIRFALPAVASRFSVVSGPLVASCLLFFLPSFLLGTLSPFAISLQKKILPDEGIGRISGDVFFWSTLGSIFGSLSAGFFLIPRFGLQSIIMAVGYALLGIGLCGQWVGGIGRKAFFKNVLAIAVVIGTIVGLSASAIGANVLVDREGTYGNIRIEDGVEKGMPTRFLRQDKSDSGAMFLDSDALVYEYTKYYALYRVFTPNVADALVIGGGAYSIPKALLNELPRATVDVAEIEPSLAELGNEYFRVPDDPRLHHHLEDGRRLLRDSEKTYDLIFSDVYHSLATIPAHFTTKEFFQSARARLNPDGIFIANLIGDLSTEQPSFILSEIKTFRSVFPNSVVFAVDSPNITDPQNIIIVGINSETPFDPSRSDIVRNSDEVIRGLAEKKVDLAPFDFSLYPELTDDYAPVDYMASRMLERALSGQAR